MQRQILLEWLAITGALLAPGPVLANGGPIFRRDPNPPAAPKGIMAAVLPDLQPGREARLEVVKEALSLQFGVFQSTRPLVHVRAVYTIKNPTREDIGLDIGFPILGTKAGMATRVLVDDTEIVSTFLSTSEILAGLRQQARQVIDAHLARDAQIGRLVEEARSRRNKEPGKTRDPLITLLCDERGWSERDATLLWAYAVLTPVPRSPTSEANPANLDVAERALGPLKSTQYLTLLAGRFDPKTNLSYEALYTAWGGDVREQAVDLETGKIRPRQRPTAPESEYLRTRLDYLEREGTSPVELRACEAILRQLPVTFSFAPMSLIRTRLRFPGESSQVVTFTYTQEAYDDTAETDSYQLGYVVHPASFWSQFGPIHLSVLVPKGVPFRASVPTRQRIGADLPAGFVEHEGLVERKTGHLYLGVQGVGWNRTVGRRREGFEVTPDRPPSGKK
jgi:hypothetical protein